mmetsp:Transcript_48114/g.114508  ORF Transcript_48114/g.114508 Transcript_48114/m.114508 type:complete len:243 (-) Transcript_48114:228-956(-)
MRQCSLISATGGSLCSSLSSNSPIHLISSTSTPTNPRTLSMKSRRLSMQKRGAPSASAGRRATRMRGHGIFPRWISCNSGGIGSVEPSSGESWSLRRSASTEKMSRGPVGVVKVVGLIQRCVGRTSASATRLKLTRTSSNPDEPPPDEWPPPARRDSGSATRAIVALFSLGATRPPIAAVAASQTSQPGDNAGGVASPMQSKLSHLASQLLSAALPQQLQWAIGTQFFACDFVVRYSTIFPG